MTNTSNEISTYSQNTRENLTFEEKKQALVFSCPELAQHFQNDPVFLNYVVNYPQNDNVNISSSYENGSIQFRTLTFLEQNRLSADSLLQSGVLGDLAINPLLLSGIASSGNPVATELLEDLVVAAEEYDISIYDLVGVNFGDGVHIEGLSLDNSFLPDVLIGNSFSHNVESGKVVTFAYVFPSGTNEKRTDKDKYMVAKMVKPVENTIYVRSEGEIFELLALRSDLNRLIADRWGDFDEVSYKTIDIGLPEVSHVGILFSDNVGYEFMLQERLNLKEFGSRIFVGDGRTRLDYPYLSQSILALGKLWENVNNLGMRVVGYDMKLPNILFQMDDSSRTIKARYTDLDISAARFNKPSDDTIGYEDQLVRGTIPIFPPEFLSYLGGSQDDARVGLERKLYDSKSGLYINAISVYIMLTGKYPFHYEHGNTEESLVLSDFEMFVYRSRYLNDVYRPIDKASISKFVNISDSDLEVLNSIFLDSFNPKPEQRFFANPMDMNRAIVALLNNQPRNDLLDNGLSLSGLPSPIPDPYWIKRLEEFKAERMPFTSSDLEKRLEV